jgi:hypothetical protein
MVSQVAHSSSCNRFTSATVLLHAGALYMVSAAQDFTLTAKKAMLISLDHSL